MTELLINLVDVGLDDAGAPVGGAGGVGGGDQLVAFVRQLLVLPVASLACEY